MVDVRHNVIVNKSMKPNPWPNTSWKNKKASFPGGPVVKNSPANAGDTGSIPGPGGNHRLWSNSPQATQLLKTKRPRTRALQ